SLSVEKASGPGRDEPYEVVNVRVTGPEGQRLYHYDANLRFTGTGAEYVLPLSVSDPPGDYRLVFSHISGAQAREITLKVE
ncbi:MAG: hypothetical protein U9N45_02285, partial [Gemmatimonadota bacterium]|nr:hypothetical protein [Gemmatimonadota bacterium]